jgi:hypothetical protein
MDGAARVPLRQAADDRVLTEGEEVQENIALRTERMRLGGGAQVMEQIICGGRPSAHLEPDVSEKAVS